jgi:hypothetical protein
MKRRKKLWIAFAALTVVVMLCAAALFYRPVPYRFLHETRPDYIRTAGHSVIPTSAREYTAYIYRVEGSVEAIAAEAHKELTDEAGWAWSRQFGYEVGWQPRREESVVIQTDTELSASGGPCVTVIIEHPTALLDRFRQWLHDR